jgi:hypothetical protein
MPVICNHHHAVLYATLKQETSIDLSLQSSLVEPTNTESTWTRCQSFSIRIKMFLPKHTKLVYWVTIPLLGASWAIFPKCAFFLKKSPCARLQGISTCAVTLKGSGL